MKDDFSKDVKTLKNSILYRIENNVEYDTHDLSFLKENFEGYKNYSGKSAFDDFKKIVHLKSRKQRFIRIVSGVAAVLCLALSTVWFYNYETSNQEQYPAEFINLKIADGTIVYNPVDNIELIKEHGVNIEYEDGVIIYKIDDNVQEEIFHELNIPYEAEMQMLLNDGTRVWLNSDTKIRYPVNFVGDTRVVELDGEAFFEVQKDERPFIVKTLYGDVKVLGTSFGITCYSGDEKGSTTLVTGRISFSNRNEEVFVEPGQQVVFDSLELTKREVDLEEYVGWRYGKYIFKNLPLEDIVNKLQRWYGITVKYEDPTLRNLKFNADLKRYDDITILLDAMARTGDLKYEINGKVINLYK